MTDTPRYEYDPEAATPKPAGDTSLYDLAMKIRYDLTAAQAKLTELLRQIAALPDQGRLVTAHDRAIARALRHILDGDWDNLAPHQLQVELDDLGIAHADRAPLEHTHSLRRARAGAGRPPGDPRPPIEAPTRDDWCGNPEPHSPHLWGAAESVTCLGVVANERLPDPAPVGDRRETEGLRDV